MENVKLVTHAHDNPPDVVLAYDGSRVGANQQIGTSSARLQTAGSYNKENMNKNEKFSTGEHWRATRNQELGGYRLVRQSDPRVIWILCHDQTS